MSTLQRVPLIVNQRTVAVAPGHHLQIQGITLPVQFAGLENLAY